MTEIKLKVLPSKVILNGNILTLNELNDTLKYEITLELTQKISNILSTYYSSNIDEWNRLIHRLK